MITLVNCVAPHGTLGGLAVPPPGLLSLAAAVREAGIPVCLKDLATGNAMPSPEEFPCWLGEASPFVGFSTMSNMLPYALEAARCLKAASPQTTILFGGCGTQAAIREILEEFEFVDFAFYGEGEQALPEFLRRHVNSDRWQQVTGLAFRQNGRVVVNPPAARIAPLDALPMPAYDLVNLHDYNPIVSLMTARGCPFACTYCESVAFWERRVTSFSVSRMVSEIKHLQATYHVSRFGFADDTFTALRPRALQFCRAYQEGSWEFRWGCAARVDTMDRELMRELARANCQEIYFGVESGSDRTLRAVRKGVSQSQISEVVPRAREYFSEVTASFVWGFPFEELSDFEETLVLAAYLRTYGIQVQLHLWSPMTRSALFDRWSDQLVFDPAVQSDIVPGDLARYQSLVRSNARIFSPFYHVPHPAFEEKRAMMKAMGFAA